MSAPVIYFDPTSEPCRAVYWLCLEAALPYTLQYIWIVRNEHLSRDFLAINPMHQVPAMKDGSFCLSEATAIMAYLTDVNECTPQWFGADARTRACINRLLSWYHMNLRKALTLDYYLPVLLLPTCLGAPRPGAAETARRLETLKTVLGHLNRMLSGRTYLAGESVSAPDLLFASEMCAFEIAPNYDEVLEPHGDIRRWLERLKLHSGYAGSHREWNHISPLISAAMDNPTTDPAWIADRCEEFNARDKSPRLQENTAQAS